MGAWVALRRGLVFETEIQRCADAAGRSTAAIAANAAIDALRFGALRLQIDFRF